MELDGEFLDERRGEVRDILETLAQRRHGEFNDVQPVIQIAPEPAGIRLRLQLPVGGRDDANIDLLWLHRSDALHFPVLDDAQQLCLHGTRQFTDLVEEQSAAISGLEQTGLVVGCACKRAAHVSEQLALE